MPRTRHPQDFLPLSSDAAIILVVLAAGASHGYGIIREAAERSEGEIQLQTGALYRHLRRLLTDGLIAESAPPRGESATDERRRYYALTPLGRAVLDAEVTRMARLVNAARQANTGARPRLA
jgi:DNA-binding PadR family transcriptional regulator